MNIEAIILVVHVLLALALLGLILIQHGKGADAGAAFGSGASGTVFGASGSGSFLTKITTWVAIRGMPEFMENLRKACFEMRKWKDVQNKDLNSSDSASKSGITSLPAGQEEPSYIETPVQYSSQTATNYSNNAYA